MNCFREQNEPARDHQQLIKRPYSTKPDKNSAKTHFSNQKIQNTIESKVKKNKKAIFFINKILFNPFRTAEKCFFEKN